MLSQSSRPNHRGPAKPNIPIEARLADEARFFRSWLDNPMIAGAVSPSGRFLARMMARYVDPLGVGPIVELGPGTGAITEALLERGVAPERLVLVEFDPGFCKLLKRRFPGVRVVQGDAYHLTSTLANQLEAPPAAIVSSLPLLMKPEMQRLALLADAFAFMAPDACFIQFTYGPVSPMPRSHAAGLGFKTEASPPVWLNLPPARVWIYRRHGDDAGVPQQKSSRPAQEFFDRVRVGAEKMQVSLKKEIEGARARLQFKPGPTQPARNRPILDHLGAIRKSRPR